MVQPNLLYRTGGTDHAGSLPARRKLRIEYSLWPALVQFRCGDLEELSSDRAHGAGFPDGVVQRVEPSDPGAAGHGPEPVRDRDTADPHHRHGGEYVPAHYPICDETAVLSGLPA